MVKPQAVIGKEILQVLPSKKELTCPHIHNGLLNKLVFTDLKEVWDSSIVRSLTFTYTEIIMVGRLTLLKGCGKGTYKTKHNN